jgi:hypothetical protein
MNQNNFDRAKEFFLKAVQIDARCYQAYDQLITNSLLDPDEGTSLQSLTITNNRTCLVKQPRFPGHSR